MSPQILLAVSMVFVNGNYSSKQKERKVFSESSVQSPVEQDITGVYLCEGENPNGGKYQGIVTIEKNGRSYVITWVIGRAQPVIGVGVRNSGVLSTSYVVRVPQGIGVAVAAYRIESDLKLSGRFTELGGDGTVRTETLTFKQRLK